MSRKWLGTSLGIGVVVAVVLIVVMVDLANTAISVTAIDYTSHDDACGINGDTQPGYTGGSGGSEEITITLGGGPAGCTVTTVSTTTAGFSISGANVPLKVPSQGSARLSFTVTSPTASYSGVLTLDVE